MLVLFNLNPLRNYFMKMNLSAFAVTVGSGSLPVSDNNRDNLFS